MLSRRSFYIIKNIIIYYLEDNPRLSRRFSYVIKKRAFLKDIHIYRKTDFNPAKVRHVNGLRSTWNWILAFSALSIGNNSAAFPRQRAHLVCWSSVIWRKQGGSCQCCVIFPAILNISILKITFFVCVQHSFSLFLFSLPSNDLCWWFSPLFYSFCTLFPPFFAYFIRASFTCVHSAYYKLFVVWVTLNNKRLLWTITGSHVSFCRVSV